MVTECPVPSAPKVSHGQEVVVVRPSRLPLRIMPPCITTAAVGANMPLSVRVVGVTPLESPAPRLVAALGRAGALAILDLGREPNAASAALAALERETGFRGAYGVRFPDEALDVVRADALPAR